MKETRREFQKKQQQCLQQAIWCIESTSHKNPPAFPSDNCKGRFSINYTACQVCLSRKTMLCPQNRKRETGYRVQKSISGEAGTSSQEWGGRFEHSGCMSCLPPEYNYLFLYLCLFSEKKVPFVILPTRGGKQWADTDTTEAVSWPDLVLNDYKKILKEKWGKTRSEH